MIIKGSGEIELVNENQKEGEGKVIKLKPFDCYALNGQERHFLRASPDEDMEVIWYVHSGRTRLPARARLMRCPPPTARSTRLWLARRITTTRACSRPCWTTARRCSR